MDHAEARDVLETAALEPDGLDRIAAGDSPEAAALVGHLVGCAACTGELERLRRSVGALRLAVRAVVADGPVAPGDVAVWGRAGGSVAERPGSPVDDVLPAELRERTLTYVRAVGRVRGATPVVAPSLPAATAASASAWGRTSRPSRPVAWLVGLAAVLVVGIGIGGFAVGRLDQGPLDRNAASVAALGRVNAATARIAAESGAESVALTNPAAADATGSLVYSPTTGEIAVVMNGLARPAAGREYRCWVTSAGTTAVIGRMYFGGDVGYWTGAAAAVTRLAPGATFGITLVDVSTGSPVGGPVLTGTL